MLIDQQLCVGCKSCLPYCPAAAIKMDDDTAQVNLDDCVECGVCRRVQICPVDAIYQQPVEWPRSVRAVYSDPLNVHKETGLAGRGTEEIKTNDVTGRFKRGFVGVALEMGRPGIGARLSDLEKMSMALAQYGVEFEPRNPLSNLINPTTGELPTEIRNEKVMSAIVEFAVRDEQLIEVLNLIEEKSKSIDTVFSVVLASRATIEGKWVTEKLLSGSKFTYRPNAKVCVGLGKPYVD